MFPAPVWGLVVSLPKRNDWDILDAMSATLATLVALLFVASDPAPGPAQVLGQGFGQGGTDSTAILIAQTFDLPVEKDDSAATAKTKNPKKKKKKNKPIRTEDDLWSAPEDKAADEQPDVEEVDPDDVEDLDPPAVAKPKPTGDLGGWGAEVERDSWGDEHRLKDPPLDKPEPGDDGTNKDPDKRPKPGDKPGPGTKPPGDEEDPKRPADGGDLGDKEPGDDAGEPGDESDPSRVPPEAMQPPSGTMADLVLLWEQRRIHLDQRDFALASKDLERFMKLRQELAIENMYLPANALIREADRARQRQDDKQAALLLDKAVDLAPDLPRAHLARTSYYFSDKPFGLGRVFGGLTDAASAALRSPLIQNRVFVNLVVSVLLALSMAVILFSLLQLLRYLKLFLHDFHHIFPRGVAFVQTGILGILILMVPVFFRSGLVIILLSWLLMAWIYQNLRERVLTVLALLIMAGAPFALDVVVHGLNKQETTFGDLVQVAHGLPAEESLRRIRARLTEEPDNHVLLATMAGFHKRAGQLSRAEEYYRRASSKKPNSVVLLNNLGNVLFLKDDLKGALAFYKRATQVQPDQVVPYFNLSRAYFRSANLKKGKESAGQAIQMDQLAVRKLRELADTRMANYAVADLSLPDKWLAAVDGKRETKRLERAKQSLWRASAGTASIETFWYFGAGAVLLFGLMLVLRAKVFGSNGCARCGRPACRRCTPELRDDSICGQCFHTFVKKSQVDARSRISKEIKIRQYRRRKESLARGITFFLPGLGQMLKGRTLRGALILVVFCLVLVQVLLGSYVMRDPITMGSLRNWLLLVPLLVVFAGFYAWAILDVFRAEDY